jgi:hypothetical protein
MRRITSSMSNGSFAPRGVREVRAAGSARLAFFVLARLRARRVAMPARGGK